MTIGADYSNVEPIAFNDPFEFSNPFIPTKLIVVYEDVKNKEVYIEQHRIKNGVATEGQPLTKKMVQALMNSYAKHLPKQLEQESVNCNLLFYNQDATSPKVVWKVPSRKRYIYFSKLLELKEGKVKYPNLLFCLDKGELFVFAYEKWKNLKTELLQAPFHNINGDKVCLGNLKVKDEFTSIESLMLHYEGLFFSSEFSHAGDIDDEWLKELWTPLVNTDEKFPYHKLKKLDSTVDDL